jgi:methylglutaconyl-CoA hydratase
MTVLVSNGSRGVVTLTLNRPERGNAMNQPAIDALYQQLDELADDPQVRVILLRGNGRHFCAGADVSGLHEEVSGPSLPDLVARVDGFPKPTIALVHGGAIGGGLAIAAACDVLLATAEAFFSIPELRLGLVPAGLLPFFLRAIGARAFRRYGISGERIFASEALRLGLVHQVVSAGELEAAVDPVVDAMLHAAPLGVRRLKAVLVGGAAAADDPGQQAELEEGRASFREKRKPAWYPD